MPPKSGSLGEFIAQVVRDAAPDALSLDEVLLRVANAGFESSITRPKDTKNNATSILKSNRGKLFHESMREGTDSAPPERVWSLAPGVDARDIPATPRGPFVHPSDIGLDVHRKKDSTGICFIGERAFRAFLAQYLKGAPGDIVDEGGQVIGQHPGLHHFTLGQRKGLHIGGRRGAAEAPWYVVAKDAPRRRLMASQDPNHPLIMHRRLATAPFHWINRPARLDRPLLARIRHRQGLQTCHIESVADDGSLIVDFDNAQRAAAPGQYLALYDGMACLGSGELRNPPPPA